MNKITILSGFMIIAAACSPQAASYAAETEISGVEKFFLEGKYARAIDAAEYLIDARARNRDELYYLKGLSELKTGAFKEARQSFECIISKYGHSPRVFDAYVGIGDSYLMEGDLKNAQKAYENIAQMFPEDKNISVVHKRIADCRDKMGMPGQPPLSPKITEAPLFESGRLFSVQVGSFRSKRNAERTIRKLARNGYEGYMEIPASHGEKLYRVRVGKLKTAEEVKSLERRLQAGGYRTKICSDDSCE